MDKVQDDLFILQQKQVAVPSRDVAQRQRCLSVSAQVRRHHRVSVRLQILRKSLIAPLVFLHSVNDFHHGLRVRRIVDPQRQLISVL